MNKLLGFYELRDLSLPTIPWKEYVPGTELSNEFLWTIRSAVNRGDDLNLPRLIGKPADEATIFANMLYKEMKDKGMVIYYPFFVAKKSGTLNVCMDKIIIEAVKEDLWNLVTNQNLDVSLIYDRNDKLISFYGNKEFMDNSEIEKLLVCAKRIYCTYRDKLLEGKTLLLEWSFAFSCNRNKEPVGEPYLVFYEIRTTK